MMRKKKEETLEAIQKASEQARFVSDAFFFCSIISAYLHCQDAPVGEDLGLLAPPKLEFFEFFQLLQSELDRTAVRQVLGQSAWPAVLRNPVQPRGSRQGPPFGRPEGRGQKQPKLPLGVHFHSVALGDRYPSRGARDSGQWRAD